MAVTWGRTTGQHTIVEAMLRDATRAAAGIGRLMRAEAEIATYAVQQGRERERQVALTRARLVADAILESFFAGTGMRDREARLGEMQQYVLAPSPASWGKLAALRDRLHASPIGIASFHWELEFEARTRSPAATRSPIPTGSSCCTRARTATRTWRHTSSAAPSACCAAAARSG